MAGDKRWSVNATPPFVFSPDGAEIVYADDVDGLRDESGNPARTGRLCRLDLNATGGSPRILFAEYESDQIPSLCTRYGSNLFYKDPLFSGSLLSDGLELFTVAATGGQPRTLGISTLVYDDWISPSPNHTALAICAGENREVWQEKHIAVVDLKSNELRYLTDRDTATVMPSWSPDGKRIAYSAAPWDMPDSNPDQTLFRRRIWLADPAGVQAPRRLTGDDRYRDEEPMWLADGQHILFCRVDGAKGCSPKSVMGVEAL